MKVCPVCGAGAADTAETCFGCLYSFTMMSISDCEVPRVSGTAPPQRSVSQQVPAEEPHRAEYHAADAAHPLAVEVYEGGAKRSVVRSRRGSIYVGSEAFNDIAIGSASVARRHLHLYRSGSHLVAEPMDPAAEVYVNGALIRGAYPVDAADRLAIHDVELVIAR